ncbi:MAG TPA: metalloregulator ArsR/SmtB family transcription factor [bacterium]|nr:metalloregulator ArsR/SmtB family transcription factor [bacterium]HOL46692.1 metalloregulator ArsR/SmtB family transcription factor [bacterium]HPQ18380.1 metalloregulator ArsR/SmtB family transcription factor [bacterium]
MKNKEKFNISLKSIIKIELSLQKLSTTFKIIADPTRIKIIALLSEKELAVNDISKLLSLSQSLISHQLQILKSANLVRYKRKGKKIFYRLDDIHIKNLLCEGLEHINEKKEEK